MEVTNQSEASAAEVMMKPSEVEFARCECCGLTEECTEAYVNGVRERHGGRWICSLCAEAVKDEITSSKKREQQQHNMMTTTTTTMLGTDEALNRHMKFCQQFRSSSPAGDLICATKYIIRRSLDKSPASGNNVVSFVQSSLLKLEELT